MKQTAVEWLYNNLKSHFEHDGDLLECVQMSMQQAKEIEKEQHRKTYHQGLNSNFQDFEQYYNETFNTNQENLQDSTNGYTYYPQENKTVFNTKEK